MRPNTQLSISSYSHSVTACFRGFETRYQSFLSRALEV